MKPIEYAGYAALVAGGPAIQAAHHTWVRAGISLGMRAGVAALVATGPLEADPSGAGDEGQAIRGVLNAFLPLALIIGIEATDIALATWEPGEPEPMPRVLSVGGAF